MCEQLMMKFGLKRKAIYCFELSCVIYIYIIIKAANHVNVPEEVR
jgi:hypothetical protein